MMDLKTREASSIFISALGQLTGFYKPSHFSFSSILKNVVVFSAWVMCYGKSSTQQIIKKFPGPALEFIGFTRSIGNV